MARMGVDNTTKRLYDSADGGGEFGRADEFDHASREGAHARPGNENAGEVQRIGCGNGDAFGLIFGAPEAAQEIDGFRAGELFADESGDEAAPADFTAS